jgi:hypothetical protein
VYRNTRTCGLNLRFTRGRKGKIRNFESLLFASALFYSLAARTIATDQVYHKVQFNDAVYSMTSWPLEDYWQDERSKPSFMVQRTSNWCGYVSEWEIKENGLWLISVDGVVDGKRRSINDVLGDGERFKATWFTGTLQLLKGKYGTGAIGTEIPEGYIMTVENGVVKSSKLLRPHTIKGPGKIGIVLKKADGKILIESLSPNGPAVLSQKITTGDQVVGFRCNEWGERSLLNLELNEARALIRGLEETEITLFMKKPSYDDFVEVRLTRQQFFRAETRRNDPAPN